MQNWVSHFFSPVFPECVVLHYLFNKALTCRCVYKPGSFLQKEPILKLHGSAGGEEREKAELLMVELGLGQTPAFLRRELWQREATDY